MLLFPQRCSPATEARSTLRARLLPVGNFETRKHHHAEKNPPTLQQVCQAQMHLDALRCRLGISTDRSFRNISTLFPSLYDFLLASKHPPTQPPNPCGERKPAIRARLNLKNGASRNLHQGWTPDQLDQPGPQWGIGEISRSHGLASRCLMFDMMWHSQVALALPHGHSLYEHE